MNHQPNLGTIGPRDDRDRRIAFWSWGLFFGWILTSIGYYGEWIAHPTSALTLSGPDMAEFVKFLPAVMDGSLSVIRQLFYLPPLVVSVTVALLIGSPRLTVPAYARAVALILAIPVSLQMLPPAWSVASLRSPEFMPQTLALIGSWILLALFWLVGRVPLLWSGLVVAALGLVSLALCAWHIALIKPAINAVYGMAPGIGWGFWVSMVGLMVLSLVGFALAIRNRDRRGQP